jgi:ribosome modulation factor
VNYAAHLTKDLSSNIYTYRGQAEIGRWIVGWREGRTDGLMDGGK